MRVLLLALFFVAAGTLHFIFASAYMRIVPAWLPAPGLLVIVSGLAEIAGGLGVLWPRSRRAAGWGLIALCIAVLPANVQMLQDAGASGASAAWITALWLRLPLQAALVWWIGVAAPLWTRRTLPVPG